MQRARSLRFLAVAQAITFQIAASPPARAVERQTDIGTVLATKGRPIVMTSSGKPTPLAILGTLHYDDRLSLAPQEYIRFCDEMAGTLVEIAGPGTVTLTGAGPVRSEGTPLITTSRHCEASAAMNTNGGVLLRSRSPRAAH